MLKLVIRGGYDVGWDWGCMECVGSRNELVVTFLSNCQRANDLPHMSEVIPRLVICMHI
jgi:hypothetical protein